MASPDVRIHLSPKGYWQTPELRAHGWPSGNNLAKKWTYWWLTFHGENVTKAEYELLRDGVILGKRTPLAKSPLLFAKTGFVDDEPDEDDEIGGAAKLDAGIYAVDYYLTINGVTHILRGVRFEVAERNSKEGGWQITTPLPDDPQKS